MRSPCSAVSASYKQLNVKINGRLGYVLCNVFITTECTTATSTHVLTLPNFVSYNNANIMNMGVIQCLHMSKYVSVNFVLEKLKIYFVSSLH